MATVVGSFANNQLAISAVEALQQAGFSNAHLGLLSRDKEWSEQMKKDLTGTKMEEGAGLGAAGGAIAGVGLGLAVAAGLLPPLGPAIAGGSLIALLASAGSGAAAGTIIGGLVGLGIPEDEAVFFEGEYRTGRTLVVVNAASRKDEAQRILRGHGGKLRSPAAATSPASTTP